MNLGHLNHWRKNEFGIKVHPYEVRTFVQFLNMEFGTEIKVGELTNPSEPVDLVCPECNKGFESKRGLTQHIDRVHYLSNEFHHCDKCEYKTRYRKILKNTFVVLKNHLNLPSYQFMYVMNVERLSRQERICIGMDEKFTTGQNYFVLSVIIKPSDLKD